MQHELFQFILEIIFGSIFSIYHNTRAGLRYRDSCITLGARGPKFKKHLNTC